MLELPIQVKKNGDITITQNTAYLEETMYAEKKGEKLKEKYIELVNKLKSIEDIDSLIISKDKKKDSLAHWEIGKIILDFIEWCYGEAMEVPNLSIALSKSIGGHATWWEQQVRFCAFNPGKEYVKYPWWVCRLFTYTANPKTREILVKGYNKGLIKDQNEMDAWRDIIETGKIRPLAESRKKIIEYLKKKDGTQDEIAEGTGLTRDSVRGRISELQGVHGYVIKQKGNKYHLESYPTKEWIESIKNKIKKVK